MNWQTGHFRYRLAAELRPKHARKHIHVQKTETAKSDVVSDGLAGMRWHPGMRQWTRNGSGKGQLGRKESGGWQRNLVSGRAGTPFVFGYCVGRIVPDSDRVAPGCVAGKICGYGILAFGRSVVGHDSPADSGSRKSPDSLLREGDVGSASRRTTRKQFNRSSVGQKQVVEKFDDNCAMAQDFV